MTGELMEEVAAQAVTAARGVKPTIPPALFHVPLLPAHGLRHDHVSFDFGIKGRGNLALVIAVLEGERLVVLIDQFFKLLLRLLDLLGFVDFPSHGGITASICNSHGVLLILFHLTSLFL